jgi:hypothetical protein
VLHNGYIETARVLLTAADPEGVWRVEGVPIVELMEADPASHKEWSARFAVTPAQLEGAEAWLRSRGVGPSEERKRGERLTASRRIPQSDAHA